MLRLHCYTSVDKVVLDFKSKTVDSYIHYNSIYKLDSSLGSVSFNLRSLENHDSSRTPRSNKRSGRIADSLPNNI